MLRFLVVEDSPSMRNFVRAALELGVKHLAPCEVEIDEASSGFDALRLLPRGHYDLVITDINMPDVNGLELVKFIRGSEVHAGTRILLISTLSSARDQQRGLALGANAYLAKPFTPESLWDEVSRQLSLKDIEQHG